MCGVNFSSGCGYYILQVTAAVSGVINVYIYWGDVWFVKFRATVCPMNTVSYLIVGIVKIAGK